MNVIKTAVDDFGAYVRVLNSANKCKYRDRKRINNLTSLSKTYTQRKNTTLASSSSWLWAVALAGLVGIGIAAMMRMGYLPVYLPM